MRLRIQLLGGFRAEAGETVAGPPARSEAAAPSRPPEDSLDARFESQKVRALLAYLACHPGRDLTRDHLADLLWPDSSPDAARRNLRQALYNLRQGLGEEAADRVDTGGAHNAVRFRPAGDDFVDAAAFETAVHRGLPGGDEVVAAELARAADLYQGDFLAGFLIRDSPGFEDWLITEQERLRESMVQALRALVDHFSARGEYTTAVRYCRRLITLDPLSEEAHRELMRLHVLAGRRRQALTHYEELTTLLERELGTEPLPETRALYQGILEESLPAEESRPQPASQTPLGPFVPMVGRGDAVAALQASCRRAFGDVAVEVVRPGPARMGSGPSGEAGPRLVLVDGEAGIGKTRLVRSFLNQVSSQRGAVVAQGRCSHPTPWNGSEPFVGLLRGLRSRLADDLNGDLHRQPPETMGPETLGPALEATVAALLETGRGPLVLFLDDLELASPTAVSLLTGLLERFAGHRLWIAAAANLEALSRHHPLRELPGRPDVDLVLLPRLDDAEVREVCAALLGEQAPREVLAEHLFRASEGLPLAMVESINALCDLGLMVPASRRRWSLQGTPAGVEATRDDLEWLILERVDRLPSSARRLLTLAAVIGPVFDVELLQRAAHEHIGVVEIGIELMLERWLIRQHARRWTENPRERDLVLWAQGARRGGFEFAHRVIRDTVYGALNPLRRGVLHRQVGEALAERHEPGPEASPERIAHHFLEAGEPEAALPYLAEAAERALTHGDEAAAKDLLDRCGEQLARVIPASPAGERETWEHLRREVEAARRRLSAPAGSGR